MSLTSPRLQRWAMFMSQFSYEIVYKKGRLHSNADGLSRMTYEPTEIPTPAVTDALMDDNFVNAVDLGMRESDFNSWLVQLANEDKASYRFGGELLHYTAAIDVDVLMGRDRRCFEGNTLDTGGTSIDCNAGTPLVLISKSMIRGVQVLKRYIIKLC